MTVDPAPAPERERSLASGRATGDAQVQLPAGTWTVSPELAEARAAATAGEEQSTARRLAARAEVEGRCGDEIRSERTRRALRTGVIHAPPWKGPDVATLASWNSRCPHEIIRAVSRERSEVCLIQDTRSLFDIRAECARIRVLPSSGSVRKQVPTASGSGERRHG